MGGGEGGKEEKKEQDKSGKGKPINNSPTFFHSLIHWCSFSPEYDRKEQKEEKTRKQQQQQKQKRKASALPGLNQRPQDLQSYALPLS